MPTWSKISFQNRNSPLIEHLVFFHDHSIIILTRTTLITLYLIISNTLIKSFNRFFLEAQEIEIFWTLIPAFLLIFIAFPSLKTLYILEESISPLISIKTIGFQWFWNYEYSNLKEFKYNSIINRRKIFRLIESSNHLILPINIPIRIIISSKDVIHSWTIPSLGVKIDAIPGRINQISILINRPGIFIGQCSEICGAGHRFIPISLEAINLKKFKRICSLGGW